MGGKTKLSNRKLNKQMSKEKADAGVIQHWQMEQGLRSQAISVASQIHLGTQISHSELVEYAESIKGYLAAKDVLERLKKGQESKEFENKLKVQ